ncbi:MAG: mercuric transporter MerT family protein [Gammaproteobacteria bacterium]|nr:mercuric transporter MerT family protein [Gammaproteobacteria bacterium]MDH5802582.1 mercuric transporter MerT family protein [Gammaproteobacteria bacterium]
MHNNELQTTSQATSEVEKNKAGATGTLIAGLLAGITASACCAGPLLLLMLGISGSWIGNLSALEPARPVFIVAAVILIGLAYRKVYRPAKACNATAVCSTGTGQRSQRILFWIFSITILLSIAFPWYGPLLFD